MSLWQKHAIFEKNSIVLVVGILIVLSHILREKPETTATPSAVAATATK